MTQIASLLAVATIIDLLAPFYSQGGGGAYMRDKSTCVGTWAKNGGGGGAYARGGGVIAGFYGNYIITTVCLYNVIIECFITIQGLTRVEEMLISAAYIC